MDSSEDALAPAPARPWWWLAVVCSVQLATSGLFSVVFALEDLHEVGVVVFWAMAWGVVLLIGAFSGVACWVRAHRVTARLPARLAWLGVGAATLSIAHWAPMLLWTPVALFFSLFTHDHRKDDYLVSAIAGLVAWVVVPAAAALLLRARRRVQTPGEVRPYKAGLGVLAEWFVTAIYAAPLALVAGAVIADGGDGRAYGWVVLPALLGVTMLFATPAAWAGAAADMAAARFGATHGDWRWSFVGRLSLVLALVGLPLFGMTLLPTWEDGLGQRFGVQMCTVVLLGGATWVFSRWRLPVGTAPVPG